MPIPEHTGATRRAAETTGGWRDLVATTPDCAFGESFALEHLIDWQRGQAPGQARER